MTSLRVRLTFPENLVRQPIVARLAREWNVLANIRKANVDENEGWIVCELEGESEAIEGSIAWLRDSGVLVDLLGDVVES